ncbi:coatomer subunit delta-like [Panonychus citri]|uniref:coatomer subunit delta-like n=1 Tax=Panonychus citri TaxID=50023 RepID=UPI0023077C93|nr:coatomer subunit delta-like [Panonychus citri]
MVLLASAIVSKQNGKILVSRQFVEMTRSRIEGLLTAFTKLITKDKQHTFIETDAVRYVYQALMDKLYCVLITTKTSNILEDLETLRLFVRVISEYTSNQGKTSDEQAILDNAFTLIFAFDEIVALGYRESVNMSQVRTFIEMDSHEERVYVAVRQTQEREAKQKMREKAKELSKLQRTQQLSKSSMPSISSSSNASSVLDKPEPVVGDRASSAYSSTTSAPVVRSKGPSRALKLGSKAKQAELFAAVNEEQLANELKEEEPNQPIPSSNTIGGYKNDDIDID